MREAYMHKKIREKLYERYGKLTVDARGVTKGNIKILKLSTLNGYGETGWMDMLIMARGHSLFMELKAPGKKRSPVQEQRAKEVVALGFKYSCQDSIDGAVKVASYFIDHAMEGR